MRTLLQLVNAVREEGGASGGTLSTLSSVTGESLRVKNWVILAWKEIQSLHRDWTFMRGTYSFATTEGDGDYTSADAGIAADTFSRWSKTRCTCYLTSAGTNDEYPLIYLPFENFRLVYQTGTQTNSRPQHYSIGLSAELLIGPKPDDRGYTITGDFEKAVQALSSDDDAPIIPEQDEIIVYRALQKYARYEAAGEIYEDAKGNYRRILSDLEAKYLPEIVLGGPLT